MKNLTPVQVLREALTRLEELETNVVSRLEAERDEAQALVSEIKERHGETIRRANELQARAEAAEARIKSFEKQLAAAKDRLEPIDDVLAQRCGIYHTEKFSVVSADKMKEIVRRTIRAEKLRKVLDKRMCVNCGRTRPASEGRETPHKDCSSPEACTWDYTPEEAWQYWQQKYHDLRDGKEKKSS